MNDGLKNKHREAIIAIISANEKVERAVLFGSRAMETFTPTSDVDIALFGDDLTLTDQAKLAAAIDELLIPQRVDVLIHKSIKNKKLIEHIDKHGVEWINRRWGMGSDWPKVELGPNCSKIGSGATPRGGSKVYLDKGEVALIRSQNVYNEGFAHDGLTYITGEHADKLANVSVEENDILLNITGDSVARCCQVDPDVLPARVNQHVAIIRPVPDDIAPRFLRYFLVSPKQQSHMLALSHAGATRKALTKGMIKSFRVPKPDPDIQRAIAHILGSLDDKIELNRQMNQTLEKMAQAIFKSWFIDFDPVRAKAEGRDTGLPKDTADLFPDNFESSELGEIPKGWEVKKARDISDVAIGKTPPRKEHEWFSVSSDDIRWVSIRDMGKSGLYINETSEFLTEEAVQRFNVRRIPDDTVLLSFKLTLGRVAITVGEMLTNEAIAHFTLDKTKSMSSHYLYCYLQSFNYDLLGSTSSIATAINSKIVKAMPVLTPSDILLKIYHTQVHGFFDLIRSNIFSIQALSSLRDTLLPKLISGELPIPDAVKLLEGVV